MGTVWETKRKMGMVWERMGGLPFKETRREKNNKNEYLDIYSVIINKYIFSYTNLNLSLEETQSMINWIDLSLEETQSMINWIHIYLKVDLVFDLPWLVWHNVVLFVPTWAMQGTCKVRFDRKDKQE